MQELSVVPRADADPLELVGGGRWRADPTMVRVDTITPSLAERLGFSPARWRDEPGLWLARLHPRDRDRVLALRTEQRDHTVDYRFLASDGRTLWLRELVFFRGASIESVVLDITADKEREIAYRDGEARYRFLAENARDMLSRTTPDGRLMYVSRASIAILGHPPADLLGKNAWDLVHPDDLPALLAHREAMRGEDNPTALTIRYKHKDGQYVSVEEISQAVRDPDTGAIAEFVCSARDVSGRLADQNELQARADRLVRITEMLARSNRELDQFAYIASHDLKAPLRGIANLSRWIEEDLSEHVTDDTREHLELLRGRVQRMESLIDAILEYSRVGRVRARPEQVEVGALVAEIADLVSPPEGFSIVAEGELPTLVTERTRLQQVLMNLIVNAIKHHHDKPRGRVIVSAEDRGAWWRFSVRDNGPGIDPRFHEKIFVIFQTLEPRDRVEGTGIGLALVKKIVESYGGSVSVESATGKGTAFHFTWPKNLPEGSA